MFDDIIAQEGYLALRIKDQAYFITAPGYINNVPGYYELGITRQGIVYHRCFIPK